MKNQSISKKENDAVSRGLFWFRHDLRLHDQPAIEALCSQVDEVSFIYIFDEGHYLPNKFNLQPMATHRRTFLTESLSDLADNMQKLGHRLHVLKGDTAEILTRTLQSGDFTHLGISRHCGYYETGQINSLKRFFPALNIIEKSSFTLFDEKDLPFELKDMPDVFSPFRRKVEKHCEPIPPIGNIVLNAKPFELTVKDSDYLSLSALSKTQLPDRFVGGETAALKHLNTYLFEWQAARTYKETRNALDTWEDSTKLSPWLANGCLSVREVMQKVKQFEDTVEKNESTYWIYFELLWREFFHWLQCKYGSKWFKFTGIQGKRPNTTFDQQTFDNWCKGKTGYPIVDACMRQLAETGYMSNRGRQLVASCFVHELRQDWRYGAAWFESQLLDFDVGSNWGNWLYLAGVGSDPRGHRQFNLQKQTQIYDPNGHFIRKWL